MELDIDLTQQEIVQLVRLIQDENRQMRELLGQVADGIAAPLGSDGHSAVLVPTNVLRKIRRNYGRPS